MARRSGGRTTPQGNSSTERLRQEVEALLARLELSQTALTARVAALESSGGGGADPDATFVTMTANASLTAERRLTAGTGISIVDGGANSTVTIASTVTPGVTDHGLLTGLGDDDHTQYLLVAGTRAMTGGLDLGTHAITNVTTVNGVSPTAHASRHQPGGADAIATATPATIGTANAEGSATSLARSDHVHAISTHVSRHQPGGADPILVGSPVAIGAALADGSSNNLARADHVHTVSSTVIYAADTLYEIDYASLATGATLVNGNSNTIDGITVTGANLALLNAPHVVNGSGILLPCATSGGTGTTYTTTSLAAANIEFLLSAISGWDGRFDILIEVQFASLTLETNGESFQIGLRCPAALPSAASTHRLRTIGIGNNSGTNRTRYTTNATTSNGDTSVAGLDVVAMRINANGQGSGLVGTYSGGWPAQLTAVASFIAQSGTTDPFNTTDARISFALGVTNDASPTTTVTVRRMRIRRF